jgi:SAM-dependent methyltransferase
MDRKPRDPAPGTPERRLRDSLPQRLELAAALRLLPADRLPRMACLDIGMPNPAMSAALRAKGGAWRTVARSPARAAEASAFLGDPSVCCLGAEGTVPFPDRSLDCVVVALGMLEALPDPIAFVRECNRVLRPSGLLVLSVQVRRALSLADALRRRAAPSGPHAATFTGKSLYDLLKSGFDVDTVDGWGRFFVEIVRLRELALARSGVPGAERAARLRAAYAAARAADVPLLWLRPHVVALSARRRQWSDRNIPALADGRSIGEAVLFHPPA